MNNIVKYLIIGAGPTGLGAAYRLKELGQDDFLVLEQSDHVGGLAASFVDSKGFTWDIGGHVIFSHYKYFDKLLAKALKKKDWLTHQREAWAWIEGRWIPYPVQSNIRHLPADTMWKCLGGLITASKSQHPSSPSNFRDWIVATFGEGLAKAFFFPYNSKVWAYPPAELAHNWISDRVARVDVTEAIRNVFLEIDDISWGPNKTFMFPRNGGTGQVWKNAARMIGNDHIVMNAMVKSIDHSKKEVQTADGVTYRYEHLLSTMPLDILCTALRPALSRNLLGASRKLLRSSSNIVGLGLKGRPPESLRTKCWIYFPEGNCPFYRVTVFSNYSPDNVPGCNQYWSLIAETSESPCKPVKQVNLVNATIQGCLNTGLIQSKADVVSVWSHRAEYGYPIPSLGREAALAKLLPAIEEVGIQSRGRFGAWKYEVGNQDHSAMQGVEWADRIVTGKPETTMF
jgi:protoporphyrinogen oxidase